MTRPANIFGISRYDDRHVVRIETGLFVEDCGSRAAAEIRAAQLNARDDGCDCDHQTVAQNMAQKKEMIACLHDKNELVAALREIQELVDGYVDIDDNGGPNLAMKIASLVDVALAAVDKE